MSTPTSPYTNMSREALLQECDRLQLLTNSQARHIKQIGQSTLNMIVSFGRVIQAHFDQDEAAVHKELAVAISKLKGTEPAAGACH